jgi:membrane peptidoglycan carboxypeptidase
MKTWRNSVLLTTLMMAGCLPAPRAYRIFLPPSESARKTEERLQELQSQFEHGLLTEEEYTRKREEILKEAQFERTLEKNDNATARGRF